MGDEVRLAAERLAKRAEEASLHNGRNPAGLAAACLYEAATSTGADVSQQVVAECGDHDERVRHGETLTCPCGFEGHADLAASETFLRENSDCEIRPMARPVRFEWDDHDWSGTPHPHDSPKEVRTNPQVAAVGR